jgi:cob(I)alamin adenosyltransferase
MRITKVYTKSGDGGQTSLATGKRVSKASLRVAAYGDVDELNSLVGLVASKISDKNILKLLTQIQNHLFVLGADLATPPPEAADRRGDKIRRIAVAEVESLERAVDHYNEALPPLEEFILPGGCEAGAWLHVARAVARRTERAGVGLAQQERVNPQALIYLNRLSDLLFVLARVLNRQSGSPETVADFH